MVNFLIVIDFLLCISLFAPLSFNVPCKTQELRNSITYFSMWHSATKGST